MNAPEGSQLARAEDAAETCGRVRVDARTALTRAEHIERTARDASERADELAANASAEHARALGAFTAVEARWTAAQSPELWRDVENARGTRDQSEVRARSLRVACEAARADHEAAVARVTSARSELEAAERAKVRADDVLRAFRADQRERDEAEAAREGKLAREREALAVERVAFNAEARRAVVPVLARVVDAAEALDASVAELARTLDALRPRAVDLRRRLIGAGVVSATQADPRDITVATAASHVAAVAIFRALAPGRSGPWEFPLRGIIARGDIRGAEEDAIADVVKARADAAEARRIAALPRAVEAPRPSPAGGFLGRAWDALTGSGA